MNEQMLNEILANFHFLRPAWFYVLIPALLLFLALRYRQRHHSNWEKAIDPHLLPHILDNPNRQVSRSPLTLLLLAWVIGTFALAGPVWRQTPQPVQEREDALVIIFDLTRSMLATDVKPDRLVRAKRKLIDLLELREEGVTALVVFAGDAHVVSPLTDDTKTIAAMIPALSPDIVPAPGSQLTPALERAIDLFRDGGMASGRILIITDEIRDVVAAQRVARQYRNAYPVSVMSVGTQDGAPVPLVPGRPDRGYLKDTRGNMVIPQLNAKSLSDFAQLAGGRYSPMTLTEEDLGYLLADQPLLEDDAYRELEREFDVWFEEGPWLLLLLLPIAALAFRRGWLWSVALLVAVLPVEESQASLWDDLWQTRDQQAMSALEQGDATKAAALFENQAWKGTANYRGDNFEDAAKQFGGIESSSGKYNLGNAFAKQGLFNEAIEAYDQALGINPNNEDAQFNKALIEQLLQEQQQQQQQDQNQDSEDSESQQDQDQNQQNQENQDQQDEQEQNESSQQEQQQQEQEPSEQEQQEQEQQEQAPQQQQASEEESQLDEEEKQALQQWLRRVPDDPGGLLRNKFQQQHETRLKEGKVSSNDTTSDW
ncbi:MAG: VWA domain-containing protein [Pseudomonadales bacterium]|nr:VWA domain-containing protein [Pseudomonadales bacterium]MBO6595952.1 VWA domain-containing protein [Pseudomonadales bacterium]MBO6822435.1 VWA domain-containing protein [Pseudomonadales bacterium]